MAGTFTPGMAGAGFPAGRALPRTIVLEDCFGAASQPATIVLPHTAARATMAPRAVCTDVAVKRLVSAMRNIMHNRPARIRSVFNQCGVHFCSPGEAFLRG